MGKPLIGIMVWRQGTKFSEPGYFRELAKAGERLGARAFLFSPTDIDAIRRKVRGFTLNERDEWVSRIYSWPEVVIDRYRRRGEVYSAIRNSTLFLYANNKFANKWTATQQFLREPSLRRWIPETVIYSRENLRRMLARYPLLYIKPGNGTGGSSVIKLVSNGKGFEVTGRSRTLAKKQAVFRTEVGLTAWLDDWTVKQSIHRGQFMIQQGIDLQLVPGRVSDCRLLIQKDDRGIWEVTGMGMRVGGLRSATSNLHGGGRAVPFDQLIRKRFGRQKAEEIRQECELLAREIVNVIEEHYGPMMEFGLDIGIDVLGRVWLIEVNPKPGRDIFKEMGSLSLYRKAVERPIQYAMFIARTLRGAREEAGEAQEERQEQAEDQDTATDGADETDRKPD